MVERSRRTASPAQRELTILDFPVGKEVRVPCVGPSPSSTWCEVIGHQEGQLVVHLRDHGVGESDTLKVSIRFLLKNTGNEPLVRDKEWGAASSSVVSNRKGHRSGTAQGEGEGEWSKNRTTPRQEDQVVKGEARGAEEPAVEDGEDGA